ncbi:MAG TPA: glycosyltransferase family 4 protein [Methylomirabilota bacterium]|nr:glycosyltransferase family 4 protein [Methylomirabilota bacterium]
MDDRPLRVLHLAANRWWTGSADPIIRLVGGLRARGHHVLLGITPGDRFEAKAREAGLPLLEGLSLRVRAAPLDLARDTRRLRALVAAEAIDIVHAHHSHDHWLALATRPRRLDGQRPRLVRTFHNARSVKASLPARQLYRRTAAVFAVSRQIESRCRGVGIPAERVSWIPGAADVSRFGGAADGGAIREEFKLGRAPVVVSVARFAANRGHELLLDGFERLLARLPEARLLLVGKGERRTRLEQLVAEKGLGHRVVFTGYRDHDLPEVLAAADCFALMAAGSDESCRAALEAMAAGCPVVARRVGALPETVVDGETGLLLGDASPEPLAAALATILADPARARAMGRAGLRRVTLEFSPERSVAIVEDVYRRIVGP